MWLLNCSAKSQPSLGLKLSHVLRSPKGLVKPQIAHLNPRNSDLVDMNGGLRIHISGKRYSKCCQCCLPGDLTLRTTALTHFLCQPPAGLRRSTCLLINPAYYSGLMGYNSRQQVPTISRYEKRKDIHLVDKKKNKK